NLYRIPSTRRTNGLSKASPPSTHYVISNADPIVMGVCNGVASSANWGYAIESRCHLGKIIRYDTTGVLGQLSNIQNHGIGVVIENMLGNETWVVPKAVELLRCKIVL
ncbi:putative lipase atg15, partial [Marasmius crinis-equi]